MFNEKTFTKAIKELAKSERVFTQRVGDRVYLCNGFWASYCPVSVYNAYARPVSARLPELNDGEGSTSDGNDPLPRIKPDSFKIEEVFNSALKETSVEVADTGFKKIVDRKGDARVFLAGDTMIYIDEKMVSSARAFCDEEPIERTFAKVKNSNPVYRVGNNFGYYMLPIRPNGNEPYVVKAS